MTLKVQFVFVLIALFCLPVNAENTIYWQTYHRPPGVMKSGEHQGQGFVQLILDEIIKHMPEYQHKMPITTLARALADMRSGKNVCHPTLLVNDERAKFIWFSQASIFNPTNRVILRRELAQRHDLTEPDLTTLLSIPDLTIALIKGRAFGGKIDEAISNAMLGDRVFKITSQNLSTMFHMVNLGRIDITIAYPFELEYFFNNELDETMDLVVLPIRNETRYVVGSVGCAKTEWGRKVISRVDEILQEIKPTEAYRNAMTTWWKQESQTDTFKNQYNQEFLQE